jgi:alkaline phosphatase
MPWNITRRKFLLSSALLSSSVMISPKILATKKKPLIRFGLLTDSHYADREPGGTRYYRESIPKMQACIEELNRQKVDFAIHLGDFKDQDPEPKEEDTLRYLKDIEAVYSKFDGPRFHCIGNHDLDSISKKQFLENVENTGIPKNKSSFSFDQKGFHFIVLDPNFHPDGRDHNHDDFNWQDANFPEEQWHWFEEDLNNSSLPTIVFCHYTLYNFKRGDHIFYVKGYQRAQQLMEKSGKVLAVFQGHVHQEDFQLINGIHYITQLGMVDYSGLENNSFAIVEVNEKEVIIHGFKRTSDQRLTL